ncbi:MAG TPA: thiamine phosphate synthase [Phycisphaerae bacterium]|nr:thiamine phosphate synthase [Phycisphaerae bacterium]
MRSSPIEAAIARILDANFNRAREAIRVMEDYARFVLDDARLSEQAKELRHALAAAIEEHHLAGAIRARDIVGDVGCEVETEREYDRSNAADVAVAAGKRLSEALRVLEEYGKTVNAAFARAVEQLRYRGYEIERRLAVRMRAAECFGHVRLYVLITEELCNGDWLNVAEAAIDGGADCLQLREKLLPDGELLERARRFVALCRRREVVSIINDRPDLAVLADADGVHVGQEELPASDARRIIGPDRIVGLSTHTIEQAQAAADQSPDYLAVGPMFATTTKPQDHIAGPQTLARVRRMTSLPLVAIGGIEAENVAAVVEAGGRCVCVCNAVIAQADVAGAARRIRERLTG